MRIYKVTFILSEKEHSLNIYSIPCEESDKTYKLLEGNSIRTYIKKAQLLKPETGFLLNTVSRISFTTFCLEQDVTQASEVVKKEVYKAFRDMWNSIYLLGQQQEEEFKTHIKTY